jgi:putative oxidoreductase
LRNNIAIFEYIATLFLLTFKTQRIMNAFIGLGKYLFALPMALFGAFHFMKADAMAGMAPFGGVVMIYLVGLCLILFAVSVFIGKYDKLAAVLLALLMIIFIITIHRSAAMAGDMTNLLKDLAIAGGALMYAGGYAKDSSVIG